MAKDSCVAQALFNVVWPRTMVCVFVFGGACFPTDHLQPGNRGASFAYVLRVDEGMPRSIVQRKFDDRHSTVGASCTKYASKMSNTQSGEARSPLCALPEVQYTTNLPGPDSG